MNRVFAAALVISVSFSLFAQPVACPSVQWTAGTAKFAGDGEVVEELATIDYDEDGKLDIVGVVNGSSVDALVWWKGAGDLTFGARTPIRTTSSLSNIVVADATGDGLDDVLVGDWGGWDVWILPATGSGRGTLIEKSVSLEPRTLVALNRDADAAMELVIGSLFQVAIYDNVSTTMTQLAFFNTTGLSNSLASADFDGDGRFDVAVGASFDAQEPRLELYYGKADGTHEPAVALPAIFPAVLRAGDLDEDGQPELVAGNWDFTGFPWEPGSVSIYRHQGARNFTNTTLELEEPRVHSYVRTLILRDISGDGHLDIVGGNPTATTLGVGDGTFRSPSYVRTLANSFDRVFAASLATGDFNGDGQDDLAIGSVSYLYPHAGSCTTQTSLYTVYPVTSVGQDAIFPVEVSGFGNDTPAPHGTVTLRAGATVLETKPVDATGKVTFTVSTLVAATHSMTAEFSGNAAIAAATSPVVQQKVTYDTTQTFVNMPPGPKVYGDAFSITVSMINAHPSTDFVNVHLNGTEYEHYSSIPFHVPTLEPGNHVISATYLGSIFRPPSTSDPVPFTIGKAPANVVLNSSLTVRSGTAFTLPFQISGNGPLQPSGTLQLIEGPTVIAGGTIANGAITFQPLLARGAHDVRVVYSGDSRYEATEFTLTLEVLPNLPFVIEARGLPHGVHIASLLPADANLNTLVLRRRQTGTPGWTDVAWNASTAMDTTVPLRGVAAYEYQLHVSLNNGTPLSSNIDSAMLLTDDPLVPGTTVKSTHFTELRAAVNLLRAQASLAPFEFSETVTPAALIRASHIAELRTALSQARTTLGMTTPAFSGAGAGTSILAAHVQEIRELAR